MGYLCPACAALRARIWATVVRRCGRPGRYDAAEAADASARSARSAAKIRIPPTERVVGRRSGLANGLPNTIEVSLICISAGVTNFMRAITVKPAKNPFPVIQLATLLLVHWALLLVHWALRLPPWEVRGLRWEVCELRPAGVCPIAPAQLSVPQGESAWQGSRPFPHSGRYPGRYSWRAPSAPRWECADRFPARRRGLLAWRCSRSSRAFVHP